MSAQQQQQIPFQHASRQRFQDITSAAWPGAGSLVAPPFQIPQVGFLSHLILQFRGTVTLSGAGALADFGPWSLINRMTLLTNQGAASIIDLTGWDAYLWNFALERGYGADRFGVGGGPGGAGNLVPNPDIYAAPVASGANTWNLTWVIPIAANFADDYILGLVNLQAPETRLNFNITTGNFADFSTLVTAVTGTFFLGYLYYEVPPPNAVALPPLVIVRLLSDSLPIAATGPNTYTVPRMGTLMQLIHTFRLNGARSDLIDRIEWKLNKTDSQYNVQRQFLKTLQRLYTGIDFPTGVLMWDFWHGAGLVSQGPGRDAYDTQAVTTIESIFTVNSGATIGVGNTFAFNSRRVFQQIG